VPLTERTRHLVDADFLKTMKDGALLVNVARDAVVNTEALLAEVESGRLHAALDVTDPRAPAQGTSAVGRAGRAHQPPRRRVQHHVPAAGQTHARQRNRLARGQAPHNAVLAVPAAG
jgi:lactate dehydrogenase-like 2-hydroxyacid dehydrogenase